MIRVDAYVVRRAVAVPRASAVARSFSDIVHYVHGRTDGGPSYRWFCIPSHIAETHELTVLGGGNLRLELFLFSYE